MPVQPPNAVSVQPEPPMPTTTSPRALRPRTAAELTLLVLATTPEPLVASAVTAAPAPFWTAVIALWVLDGSESWTARPSTVASGEEKASGSDGAVQPALP